MFAEKVVTWLEGERWPWWRRGLGFFALAAHLILWLSLAGKDDGLSAGAATGAIGQALFGGAALILAAVCFLPDLLPLTVTPFFRWIDSIYLPGGSGIPPVDYKLAQLYEAEFQFELAYDEYQKITTYHPREWTAHLGAVRCAVRSGDAADLKASLRAARKQAHDLPRLRELEALLPPASPLTADSGYLK